MRRADAEALLGPEAVSRAARCGTRFDPRPRVEWLPLGAGRPEPLFYWVRYRNGGADPAEKTHFAYLSFLEDFRAAGGEFEPLPGGAGARPAALAAFLGRAAPPALHLHLLLWDCLEAADAVGAGAAVAAGARAWKDGAYFRRHLSRTIRRVPGMPGVEEMAVVDACAGGGDMDPVSVVFRGDRVLADVDTYLPRARHVFQPDGGACLERLLDGGAPALPLLAPAVFFALRLGAGAPEAAGFDRVAGAALFQAPGDLDSFVRRELAFPRRAGGRARALLEPFARWGALRHAWAGAVARAPKRRAPPPPSTSGAAGMSGTAPSNSAEGFGAAPP